MYICVCMKAHYCYKQLQLQLNTQPIATRKLNQNTIRHRDTKYDDDGDNDNEDEKFKSTQTLALTHALTLDTRTHTRVQSGF